MEGSSLKKELEPNAVTSFLARHYQCFRAKGAFLSWSYLAIKPISSFFPKSKKLILTDEEGEYLAIDNSVLRNRILSADEIDELQQLYSGIDSEDFDLETQKSLK